MCPSSSSVVCLRDSAHAYSPRQDYSRWHIELSRSSQTDQRNLKRAFGRRLQMRTKKKKKETENKTWPAGSGSGEGSRAGKPLLARISAWISTPPGEGSQKTWHAHG